ncbi:fatty acid desaturase [Nocardia salmonicida]|uniref:fatty acid desaturase n=1 Tax=Nocardia salmonicida TaxID=53431 RepID=UPI00378F8785
MTIAILTFLAVGWFDYFTAPALVSYVISVFSLYRAGMFIHEITHFRGRRQFRAFRIVWNVFCGVPMLFPLFLFVFHSEHHNVKHYGSSRDGEYVPFALMPPYRILGVLAASPLLPFLGPYRFGILAPAAWLIPPLRRYVYQQASSVKLDIDYVGRSPVNRREYASWVSQEAGCFAVVVAVFALVTAGYIDLSRLIQWYAMVVGIVIVNTVRFLGAHRYRSGGHGTSIEGQMLDTVNVARRRCTAELWGPVGLRLHALHHLVPGLPYHAYQQAHDRLIREFGPNSLYASTLAPSLTSSVRQLWIDSCKHHGVRARV